jgi:uncharacterized membrane protein YfcA
VTVAQLVAALPAVAVGAVSGLLSGMFGIGGGIITTPAIRVMLGYPALVAVGTPLLVIVPTTLTGAWSYNRSGLADVRAGVLIGAFGIPSAVLGALATRLVGGTVVLLLTALLILYVAGDMLWHAWRSRGDDAALAAEEGEEPVLAATGASADAAPALAPPAIPAVGPVAARESTPAPAPKAARVPARVKPPGLWTWVVLGLITGGYSGFLGLGGGFVLVPLLQRLAGMPIKRAIGTSLVAISILAVPGVATHWALGNIDPRLALALLVGSVPFALVGARITRVSHDRTVRIGFAALLLAVGAWLAIAEIAGLGR